jgi:hypothetical protein
MHLNSFPGNVFILSVVLGISFYFGPWKFIKSYLDIGKSDDFSGSTFSIPVFTLFFVFTLAGTIFYVGTETGYLTYKNNTYREVVGR